MSATAPTLADLIGFRPHYHDALVPRRPGRRPMPPAVEWQRGITEGEQNGQIVSRITAATPTPGNSCGQMLDGLAGRVVPCDEDIDTDAYIGQHYTVVIGANKDNANKTQVQQIFRVPPPAAPVGGTPATTAANGT